VKTIAVFSQKGGGGKSTIAIHVSVVAGAHQKTALIDADPQGTSRAWANGREKESPAIVEGSPANIVQLLNSAEASGYELAIIDCPPHVAASAAVLVSAADLVVVPVQPSFPDLAALGQALAVIEAAGKPFVFVLNRTRHRAKESTAAMRKLEEVGKVCPTFFSDRVAFSRALISGLAVTEFTSDLDDKAAAEAVAVYEWLMEQMK
jgi:chromosome partitioning protein